MGGGFGSLDFYKYETLEVSRKAFKKVGFSFQFPTKDLVFRVSIPSLES